MDDLEQLKILPQYDPSQIRAEHLSRLQDEVYLDHAGAALYNDLQLTAVMAELKNSLLGNPHSRNRPSDTATQILHATRQRILRHFNTSEDDYAVIFTSGASAAIRLVAENFLWTSPTEHKPSSSESESSQNSQNAMKKAVSTEAVQDSANLSRDCFSTQHGCTETESVTHYSLISDSGSIQPGDIKKCDEDFPTTDAESFFSESSSRMKPQKTGETSFKSHCDRSRHISYSVGENKSPNLGCFVYTQENHTSVLGIRECAARAGALVVPVPSADIYDILGADFTATRTKIMGNVHEYRTSDIKQDKISLSYPSEIPIEKENVLKNEGLEKITGVLTSKNKIKNGNCSYCVEECDVEGNCGGRLNCLFAYSAQCNFSGVKHPLTWVDRVHQGALDTFLDDKIEDILSPKDSFKNSKGCNDSCQRNSIVLARKTSSKQKLDFVESATEQKCVTTLRSDTYNVGKIEGRNVTGSSSFDNYSSVNGSCTVDDSCTVGESNSKNNSFGIDKFFPASHFSNVNESGSVHESPTKPPCTSKKFSTISSPESVSESNSRSTTEKISQSFCIHDDVVDQKVRYGIKPQRRWFVLLDAASLVATSPLDLSQFSPDFVPVSFYKMFGYPTGLGCLLVHKRAWMCLDKRYFGGGTVELADSRSLHTVLRKHPSDRFEDGTVSFLAIAALRHGFESLAQLCGPMRDISSHVYHLARYVHHSLKSYRHANGAHVAHVYGTHGRVWEEHAHGSIVNFNIYTSTGEYVGFTHVERVATIYNIHLRTGCVCNPGSCQTYLNISSEALRQQHLAGHVCGDSIDSVDGHPTGSVRVSFGYSSTYADADVLLRMIRDCFVEGPLRIDTSWIVRNETVLENCNQPTNINQQQFTKNGEDAMCHYVDLSKDESNDLSPLKETRIALNIDSENVSCNPTQSKTLKLFNFSNEISKKVSSGLQVEEISNNKKNSTPTVVGDKKHTLDKISSGLMMGTYEKIPLRMKLDADGASTDYEAFCGQDELQKNTVVVTDIKLYPVKSCGGMSVRKWVLGERGLLFDRHWMVVNRSGYLMTLKRQPRMSLVTPFVDLETRQLVLSYPGYNSVTVPLDAPPEAEEEDVGLPCTVRVCGDRIRGQDCGDVVAQWLSDVLQEQNLRLLRQRGHRLRRTRQDSEVDTSSPLSLANEAQLLLLHRPSVRKLLKVIEENGRDCEGHDEESLVARMRGNIVFEGGKPFEEDSWAALDHPRLTIKVESLCERCQMVAVTPTTADRSLEPLLSLKTLRGTRVTFGVLASTPGSTQATLSVGMRYHITFNEGEKP